MSESSSESVHEASYEVSARSAWLKRAFFALFVRPLCLVALGLNMRRRDAMPVQGPAVIVANHNSHLDTLMLMSLVPLRDLPKVRPIAAADYFLESRWLRFIALDLIGILPITRGANARQAITMAREALDRGEVLIIFPEGSRGAPEELTDFKGGVALISRSRPDVPIVPIFLHGLGKALPKGSFLLVPFFCDAFVGKAFTWNACPGMTEFMATLDARMRALAAEGRFPAWD